MFRGVAYGDWVLSNKQDKKEKISYSHLPTNTAKEITGNPVSSAITTWYLIKNSGDDIGFVPDIYREKDWPYRDISWLDIENYKDLTDEIINELIEINILKDIAIEVFDEDDPNVFIRKLKNIWLE